MSPAVATAKQPRVIGPPRPLRQTSPLKSGLILALVALVVCLGAIELACFLWEEATAQGPLGWTLVAPRRLQLELRGTEDHPYYLPKPNASYNWSGIPVEINSRGLRTPDVQIPKPAGTIRILNLGDSVAFGWSVHQEDTYGKQLEATLNARQDGRQYEVINAAVPGWSTEDEQDFLVQEGLKYEPDVVVLDITLADDILGGVAQTPVSQAPGLTNWLRDHTFLWPMLSTLAPHNGTEATPALSASPNFPLDEQDPRWDQWWGEVQNMQQMLQSRAIRFVVAPFPTPHQYSTSPIPDVPQRVIRTRAANAGILVVDVLPSYQQACRAAAHASCEGPVNLLSADAWMDPTALGHRLAAKALAASPLWH